MIAQDSPNTESEPLVSASEIEVEDQDEIEQIMSEIEELQQEMGSLAPPVKSAAPAPAAVSASAAVTPPAPPVSASGNSAATSLPVAPKDTPAPSAATSPASQPEIQPAPGKISEDELEKEILKEFSGAGDEPWLEETLAHLKSDPAEQGKGILDAVPEGEPVSESAHAEEIPEESSEGVTAGTQKVAPKKGAPKGVLQEESLQEEPRNEDLGKERQKELQPKEYQPKEYQEDPQPKKSQKTQKEPQKQRQKTPLDNEPSAKSGEQFCDELNDDELSESGLGPVEDVSDERQKAVDFKKTGLDSELESRSIPMASLAMTVKGNMTIKLNYETSQQYVLVRFKKGSVQIQLADGTELHVPLRQKTPSRSTE